MTIPPSYSKYDDLSKECFNGKAFYELDNDDQIFIRDLYDGKSE